MGTGLQSVLIDQATGVLLAASVNPLAVEFFSKSSDNTYCIHFVKLPNFGLFLNAAHADRYVHWSWNRASRRFTKTPAERVTDALRARAHLASAKVQTIETIMGHLTQARYKVATGVLLQEFIYATKRTQAKEFKNLGYDEERAVEFPYILQYAEFAHIDLKQACDDILLKAQIDDDSLAKTELLRLRYFGKVRDASTPEELSQILVAFFRDCYGVAI